MNWLVTMRINVQIALLFVVLSLSNSTQAAASTESIVVGFQDSQVREMTLRELDRRKILYELAGDNAIRFSPGDLAEITDIARGFSDEILPPDRSANYVTELQLRLIERLDAANIPYKIVEYGDLESLPEEWEEDGLTREWIVWSEEDSVRVAEILEAFQQEILRSDFGRN